MNENSFASGVRMLKDLLKGLLPEESYRKLRAGCISLRDGLHQSKNRLQLAFNSNSKEKFDCRTKQFQGISWRISQNVSPLVAAQENFNLVESALSDAQIKWWFVGLDSQQAISIAVSERDRIFVRHALSRIGEGAPVYAHNWTTDAVLPTNALRERVEWDETGVVTIFAPRCFESSSLKYGKELGCQIEFWCFETDSANDLVLAPRENRAARILSNLDTKLVLVDSVAGCLPTPEVLNRRMLDDVTFPVDAVYTWVDGEEPTWIESKRRTEAEIAGVEYHGEANHAARFRSRDELKYSLRSLEMYAPWFRKIFIVTAGQVPDWLDTNNPKIQLIDHKDIYPESGFLPTFNSNSIISRLHHIEGLSEHYVYINDDVFFGRALSKDRFFLPNGIAKVSPSNNRRPFGDPTAQDEPHLNLTRNMRTLLEERFGITISRAIKHTPHPQLRSVHFEMEEAFREVYEQTWASRFRHHTDIVADQLHHYYAQIVGKAVPTNLRYNYINILDDKYKATMDNTLRLRHRDTFCINDAPVEGATPIPDELVTEFLDAYFPVKSSFEK